jgi:phosphoglycolate phosphatase
MRHLIAFDLDGTLVDSRLDLASSANLLLHELGTGPLLVDQVVDMVGDGARILVGRVLTAAGVDADLDSALARFLEIYDAHLVDHTGLYPGVVEALSALEAHAALALLTNKPSHHTGRLLDLLGIRRFFFEVIGGDGPWPRKPAPEGLEYLMAAAGASPQTTIMVGDSMVDVETATRASARVCVARYGFGRVDADLPAETLVVADARDLKARLLEAITR